MTLKYYNSIIGLSLVVNKTFMVDEIVCFQKSKSHCQIVEMHNYYLWSTGWRCYYPWDNGIDVNFKLMKNFKIIIITSKNIASF
jgi:hypothetical protein